MRIWLACVCCLLVGASSAQAQWLKNLGGLMRGLRGAEVQALTMTQKRAAAAAVQREVALGRIAAGTVQTHSLKRMLYGYHLTARAISRSWPPSRRRKPPTRWRSWCFPCRYL